MTDILRWGIIGTGNIAAKFAAAVKDSSSSELTAVGSRNAASAREFAARFDIPNAHEGYEEMINDDAVDAVYISTPHPFHAEWCIRVAKAGRHILCEKPVAMNFAEFMAVREAVEEHRVFFMEAFMYRCHPQTKRLLETISAGGIGKVQMIDASFGFRTESSPESRLVNKNLGGGGILDVGCYPVSMARAIAGASLGCGIAEPHTVHGTAHIGETGVDDFASALLQFDGGIIAKANCAVRCSLDNTLRIFGTEGQIIVQFPWWSEKGFDIQTKGETRHIDVEVEHGLYVYEVDEVARAVRDGRHEALWPAMTLADTEGNIRVLDKWRADAGLEYPMERSDSPQAKMTVANRPLARRDDTSIPHGKVPGLDKEVSRLVMGSIGFASDQFASVMYDYFYEHGGNCIDTAVMYHGGNSERQIGAWLANRGVRDDMVILDKGGHTPNCWPHLIKRDLEISLKRLQTDYIDIYMLHRDNEDLPVSDLVDTLAGFVRDGKVLTYGFSNWSLERIKEALNYARSAGLPQATAISQNFSLARMIDPVWAGCKSASDDDFRLWLEENRESIALMPWSSQARGFFTDRSGPTKTKDEELVRCWYSDENFERKRRAEELAAEFGVSALNIALAYTLSQPFPVFPLIGPQNLQEIRTGLPGLDVKLTEDQVAWLDLRGEREEPATS